MANKANTLLLALAVKDGARLHEESYDKDKAVARAQAYERRKAAQPEAFHAPPDFSQYYRKALEECCEEAAIKHGLDGSGRLIYLALDGWWNDALEWAEEVSKLPVDPPSGAQP